MAYSPIALTVPQYHVNGSPASGYVLKAYKANTATLLQMATDAAAGTLVNDIVLNSAGYPAVSGNIVIPHVNANFKLALYPTQAAADGNSGATWTIDNLTPTGISTDQVVAVSTLTELRNFSGASETLVLEGAAAQGDGDGDVYYKATGAAPGTYTDNGTTIIVPTGGDGSSAWLSVGIGTASIEGSFTAHTAAGTGDAQTIAPNPAITAYSSSVRLAFIPVANNTGACTLNVNSLGAKSIKMNDGTDPPAGAIDSDGVALVQYDGTNFVLLNPSGLVGLGVTATAAELNILDGVTATAAELNTLDGIRSEGSILKAVTGTLTFSSVSADSASTSQTIVHGLGTDDVFITFMAKGDNSNNFVIMAADGGTGEGIKQFGRGADELNPTVTISPPSTGEVEVNVYNGHGTTNTITVRYLIAAI